jgi:inosine-uridine nucleoside N-ribohydrolase
LRHPLIDLRAVTTVSGDARRRAAIAARLVELAGRDDVEVAAGIGREGGERVRSAWIGHEGEGLLAPGEDVPFSDRDAVTVLVEETAAAPVELVTIGPQTNVAAALAEDGTLAHRVERLAVMGGAFAPIRDLGATQPPSADYNLACDPGAAARVLNAGMPTLYVPLDVTVETYLTHHDVALLRCGDELCRAIARLIDAWTPVLLELTKGAYPPERAVALHDPLTVACTVERGFVVTESLPVTVVLHDGHPRTFVDPVDGVPAEVVRSVDLTALRDFLLGVLLGD